MLIQTVIDHIKEYHKGVFEGKQIDEQTTRDKVLYGNPHQECTGIITTCWASVDVIREAAKRGANLIIAHEALFWNHGDHTDWLQEENNQSFLAKKKLLDEAVKLEGDKQVSKWQEIFDKLSEDVPLYPIFHRKAPTAYDSTTLENFKPIALTGLSFVGTGSTKS